MTESGLWSEDDRLKDLCFADLLFVDTECVLSRMTNVRNAN